MAGEIEDPLSLCNDFVPSDSVSFGTFKVESLSWERKTSSRNPYLEELEKYARPGSVTQKKAYFEAHFKSKGLIHQVSSDCKSVADGQSNKCSNSNSLNCKGDIGDPDEARNARFDETPRQSDEDEADLCSHYFEPTCEQGNEVVASLPAEAYALNASSSFILEEIHSKAAPLETHQNPLEADLHLFVKDDRDSVKRCMAENVGKSESSKDQLKNKEIFNISSEEKNNSASQLKRTTVLPSTQSKASQRLVENEKLSTNRSKVASRRPSLEAAMGKAELKDAKSSISDNTFRKKRELSITHAKDRIEAVKLAGARCTGVNLRSSAFESKGRFPISGVMMEKTLSSRESPRKKSSCPMNRKTEANDFMNAQSGQENRRYNLIEDLNDRKIPDVCQPTPVKKELEDYVPPSRAKLVISSPKIDPKVNGVLNLKDRAERRKVEETVAEFKQLRRTLKLKTTPMPASCLDAARKGSLTLGSPGLRKKPTSSLSSSGSQGSSSLQPDALICELPDKSCSDTVVSSINGEPKVINQSSLSSGKTGSSKKDKGNVRSHLRQHLQAQYILTKGDETKARVLKSQSKAIKQVVSGRAKMVPVADIAVAS